MRLGRALLDPKPRSSRRAALVLLRLPEAVHRQSRHDLRRLRARHWTSGWLRSGCSATARTGLAATNFTALLESRQRRHGSCCTVFAKLWEKARLARLAGRGSEVESDETFVGPNPYKMHKSRKLKLQQIRGQQRRGDVYVGKTAVAGVLDRETRRVRAKVVPNVRRDTLQAAILNSIAPGSKLYTDEATTYRWAAGESEFVHEVVNHARSTCVERFTRRASRTSGRSLKRTLRGTYVAVEPFHLDRYLDEQVFRFNNRATKDNPLNDSDRFAFAHVPSRREASHLCPTDGQGSRLAPPLGGRDGARGTVLALVLAGLFAGGSLLGLPFVLPLLLWKPETAPASAV